MDPHAHADAFMSGLMKEISNIEHQYNVYLKLTTMTVMMFVSSQCDNEINLDILIERFEEEDIRKFIYDVFGYEDAVTMNKSGKNFNNSVVFKLPSRIEKKIHQAVKVFCNGNLHITGYKNLKDVLDIAEIFTTMFELMLGGNGVSNWFVIESFNVQLINFCYQLEIPENVILNLRHLHEICVNQCEYFCSYNNDHYSGIIMKANDFSILIFESGNVILTSITTKEQLQIAFSFIHNFLNKHKESVYAICLEGQKKKDERVHKRKQKGHNKNDCGKYFECK